MSYTRIPDRRKSRRESGGDGRRARKRFVIQSDYVIKIMTADHEIFYADLLDISLSGIYVVVVAGQWKPAQGESITIHLHDNREQDDVVVTGVIKYTNPGSMFGQSDCGLGIRFDEEISSHLVRGGDGSLCLAGNMLLTIPSGVGQDASAAGSPGGLMAAAF